MRTDAPRWPRRLLAALDAADARARALASPLTVGQLNWRADPASWSIGQCLDHLRVSNEVYCRAIEASLRGDGAGPVDEIAPGWFGRFFIRTVMDPQTATRKRKAPTKIIPAADVDASIVESFVRSNDAVRQAIAHAQHHDVNRVRFVNPFVPLIRFTVGTGLEILTIHDDRHLLQAERIRNHPGFPAVG